MLTFLEETLAELYKEFEDISSLTLILPSKRAGGFLKNILRKNATQTQFAPRIISIEEFIEELSDLKIIDTTELLFKSYKVYLATASIEEKEDFETYSGWASILLNDFNEIDRYLIDPKPFFNYLKSIQDLNHWYLKDQKTPLIENYLKFWNSLLEFYENLKESLLKERIGYQGMVYRKAVDDIEFYRNGSGQKTHIFIGFNALNNAEQHIFQELLETQNTRVYWDSDVHFFNDDSHSASLFLRKYVKEWNWYRKHTPQFIGNHFKDEKSFRFVEVQKNMAQAKYVGELLSQLDEEALNNTAVILADEKLLMPVLHSLPPNINSVNITMGAPLQTFPTALFFEQLLSLHLYSQNSFYYKEVLAILNHPAAISILPESRKIIDAIHARNLSHISLNMILDIAELSDTSLLHVLFGNWQNNSKTALSNCNEIVLRLKAKHVKNAVENAVLHQLFDVFSKIDALNTTYTYLNSIKTVHALFGEFVSASTLDFKGDAYQGLQIMGILETRALDFENIIITSVNEGILPAGKSNSSFITYDLKQQFGLPQFYEKDAIYTYHFYHLLHRSKRITLLYNNYSEGINAGEKSRFLMQLELEKLPNHAIEKIIVAPSVKPATKSLRQIIKTKEVMLRLQEIASKGFSPSALTNYIRNPIDFYQQKILKISEFEEVEETVAANTLGTIVHDTLEHFYKPLEGSFLTLEKLAELKGQIDSEVRKQFVHSFKGGQFDKGRNLIIFEVAKRYISNFIDYEISEIKAGHRIKILQIERTLKVEIPIQETNFPVFIGGKVDRVDEYDKKIRIIDYKTGKVEQGNLEIVDWAEITQNYKYSKVVQVLAYALMIDNDTPINTVEAGIISFKNLNSGFLKFATKEKMNARIKLYDVTQETLELYKDELRQLILEILDCEIPFTEKEIDS
jgi:hypothetical protein